MLSVHAKSFVDALAHMRRLAGVTGMQENTDPIAASGARGFSAYAKLLQKSLQKLNAPAALASIAETLALCENEKTEMRQLHEPIKQVTERLKAELGSRYLYVPNTDEEAMFPHESCLFGPEVGAQLPSTVDDVSEAAKCLALSKYSGSVFHQMRAIECSVQRLCAVLGISHSDRAWGPLLSDIAAKVEKMEKGEIRDKWSETQPLLYHVKQAWCNSTMHPKKTYTSWRPSLP